MTILSIAFPVSLPSINQPTASSRTAQNVLAISMRQPCSSSREDRTSKTSKPRVLRTLQTPAMARESTFKGGSERSSLLTLVDSDIEPHVHEVNSHGDVVLLICHGAAAPSNAPRFRVHSTTLRERSRYFAGLLDGRFGEGERMKRAHNMLEEQYGNESARWPTHELPVIEIEDLGRISTVKSIEPLCKDFLGILHDLDLQASPPVANLANLAVVADRFDALETARTYMSRKKVIRAIDSKMSQKGDVALTEEKVRQRVLVGILLDYRPWLEKYSLRMITRGWTGNEALGTDPLWWDLPSRLEEELAFRRECVLETIQSLQMHFVGLYTSRERQCRLGYDSSAQCDIFQLGQAIRFFNRVDTLRVQGTIVETEPAGPYQRDVHALIDSLRQIPEYQVDSNHSHCGIRTKLLPLLELITDSLQYCGVCAECWFNDRADSWIEAKRSLTWQRSLYRLRESTHKELHAKVWTFFSASDRDWSA